MRQHFGQPSDADRPRDETLPWPLHEIRELDGTTLKQAKEIITRLAEESQSDDEPVGETTPPVAATMYKSAAAHRRFVTLDGFARTPAFPSPRATHAQRNPGQRPSHNLRLRTKVDCCSMTLTLHRFWPGAPRAYARAGSKVDVWRSTLRITYLHVRLKDSPSRYLVVWCRVGRFRGRCLVV